MIDKKTLIKDLKNLMWKVDKDTLKLNTKYNNSKIIFDVHQMYLELMDLTKCYKNEVIKLSHGKYKELMNDINIGGEN